MTEYILCVLCATILLTVAITIDHVGEVPPEAKHFKQVKEGSNIKHYKSVGGWCDDADWKEAEITND